MTCVMEASKHELNSVGRYTEGCTFLWPSPGENLGGQRNSYVQNHRIGKRASSQGLTLFKFLSIFVMGNLRC